MSASVVTWLQFKFRPYFQEFFSVHVLILIDPQRMETVNFQANEMEMCVGVH